jgi:hypothetical protein|tara:strand:+ start:619 stop:894 length:276 start_codon:yes stop_codon:yes gene_type:complete
MNKMEKIFQGIFWLAGIFLIAQGVVLLIPILGVIALAGLFTSFGMALFGFAFNRVEISFWSNKLHEIFSKFKDKTRNVYRENKFYKYTKKV